MIQARGGRRIDDQDHARQEGIEDQRVFDKMLLEEYGEVDPRVLAAGVVGYRRAKEANMVLYPHVRQTMVDLLRMHLKLAIVSDAPRMSVWTRLVGLGLDAFFDTVVSVDDTGKRKPDPAPFRMALDRLGVAPREAVMIGDWAERDMAGAGALGIATVFARYGDDFGTQDPGADFEVADIAQLVGIVRALNARPG